ncbi:MAG: hypothetical protein C4345_14430 [Chloroflexota bacterium]
MLEERHALPVWRRIGRTRLGWLRDRTKVNWWHHRSNGLTLLTHWFSLADRLLDGNRRIWKGLFRVGHHSFPIIVRQAEILRHGTVLNRAFSDTCSSRSACDALLDQERPAQSAC